MPQWTGRKFKVNSQRASNAQDAGRDGRSKADEELTEGGSRERGLHLPKPEPEDGGALPWVSVCVCVCVCVCVGNCLLYPTEEGTKEMELKMKGLLVGPHWEPTHGSRVTDWIVSPSPPPPQFIC